MGACASSFKRSKDELLPPAAVKELASSKEDVKSVEETLGKNDAQPPAPAADGEVNSRSLGFLFEENTGKALEDVTEKSLPEPEIDGGVIKSMVTEEKKIEEKPSSSSEIEKCEEYKQDEKLETVVEMEKEIEELKRGGKGEIEEIGIEASKIETLEKKKKDRLRANGKKLVVGK